MATSDRLVKMGWFVLLAVAASALLIVFLLAQYLYLGSASGKVHGGMSRGQVKGILNLCVEKRVSPASYPAPVHPVPGISVYRYDMPYDASTDTFVWVVYDRKGCVVEVWKSD